MTQFLQNSPADDDPALLGAHHELAGDRGLEAEAVDAGRELRVLGVGGLHAVLTHRRGEVPDTGRRSHVIKTPDDGH